MPRRSSRRRLLLFFLVFLALAQEAWTFDLQAHRGGRGLRPENTLAAFANALELGVTTLELDTAVTRDRVVVISHDPYLNGKLVKDPRGRFLPARPRIYIKDLTREELETYTVGELNPRAGYAYAYPEQTAVPGQTIPTLAALFDLVCTLENETVRFNIEIKTYPPFPEYTVAVDEFAALVVELVVEYRLEERVTIQSFDWRALRAVRERMPEVSIACLAVRDFSLDGESYNLQPALPGPSAWLDGMDTDDSRGETAALVHSFGADIYSPYYKEMTIAEIETAHSLGLRVVPWTVNNEPRMRSLIAWGVDGLITDRPDILKGVLEELGISY